MKLLIMQSSPASHHFPPLKSIFSAALFSNALNLSSLGVRATFHTQVFGEEMEKQKFLN
jgi:hypothetical protein